MLYGFLVNPKVISSQLATKLNWWNTAPQRSWIQIQVKHVKHCHSTVLVALITAMIISKLNLPFSLLNLGEELDEMKENAVALMISHV